MENESRPVFSDNPNDQNRIGGGPEINSQYKEEPEVCREPTFLENQNQRYTNNLSRVADNITTLARIAEKLGISESLEDKPSVEPIPQNLLSEYEFHNDRLARANDLFQRYLYALSEVI